MLTARILDNLKRRAAACDADFLVLCQRIGIDQSTVWRWNKGKCFPRGRQLDRIDRALTRLERRRRDHDLVNGR